MLLMIDNYDSFTYNLVHYCQVLNHEVVVKYNDEISLSDIQTLSPDHIMISPGPCTPNEAGISMAVIQTFYDKIPILGVCLGHQALAQVFGARIIRASSVMHGKTSDIDHTNSGVFADLPRPLKVMRYHSLVVHWQSLPECLKVSAWSQDEAGKPQAIMGLQHKNYPVAGVQFHPESILTESGYALLQNFLSW